jgi:hypothetical protein
VALVRKQTTPTERPPLVGEISANLCGQRVSRGQRNGSPTAVNLDFLDPDSIMYVCIYIKCVPNGKIIVSASKPNRIMLGEVISFYYEVECTGNNVINTWL